MRKRDKMERQRRRDRGENEREALDREIGDPPSPASSRGLVGVAKWFVEVLERAEARAGRGGLSGEGR